jgi:hypothetical protein
VRARRHADFAVFGGVHEFRGDIAWAFLKKHL